MAGRLTVWSAIGEVAAIGDEFVIGAFTVCGLPKVCGFSRVASAALLPVPAATLALCCVGGFGCSDPVDIGAVTSIGLELVIGAETDWGDARPAGATGASAGGRAATGAPTAAEGD